MTHAQIHPEDLIDKARNDTLLPDERRRLDEHLASCAACSLELELGADLQQLSRAAQQGDDDLLERIAARVNEELSYGHSGVVPSPHGRGRRRLISAAALVFLFGGAALAAYLGAVRWASDGRDVDAGAVATSPSSDEPLTVAGQPPMATEEPPRAPPSTPPSGLTERPNSVAPVAAQRPAQRRLSAAELFARANAARRADKVEYAVSMFHKLQDRYPASDEALVSRVALGRILLQQLREPARALPQFEAYLKVGGPLEEEAMVGRAIALGRLGRQDEELNAWRALLEQFPDSMHAERAKERIASQGK